MPRQCPRCKSSLGNEPKCPTCGFQVVSPLEVRRPARQRAGSPAGKWQQTAWGKTLIGLLLAQGLYYGLLMLAQAILSAITDEKTRQEWLSSFSGLILKQVMQLVGLVVGGMVAGAGQRRGALYGTIVGVYNAILFLAVLMLLPEKPPPILLIAAPLLQTAFGTVGGFIGCRIWQPIQALAAPSGPSGEGGPSGHPERVLPGRRAAKPSPLAGPINWVRVAIGTGLAVAGTIGAHSILRIMQNLGETPGEPFDTQRQAQFLTFEVYALAMIAGGAVGGSNTYNGLKQGLLVGAFASFTLICVYIWQGDSTTPEAQLLGFKLFGFDVSYLLPKILFTISSVVPLALAGGWFGGQLLPPVIVPPRRKRMLPGMT
jgi:hypothetical protein